MKPRFPEYVFVDQQPRYEVVCAGRLCQSVEVTDEERRVRARFTRTSGRLTRGAT